jgi:5-methylcytosine-specific restriction protein A
VTPERAEVEATPRKAMTKARRLRIYLACQGRCFCGAKVPMENTVIDHRVALWMGGADEDANCRFICRPCDKTKTSGDLHVIAKVKRIIRKADPETRKVKRPIPSRPFQKSNRKIQSRGFR